MSKLFYDLPEALENNLNFPLRISYKPSKSLPTLPNIQDSDSGTPDEQLIKQANTGLKQKLKEYLQRI